MDILPKHELEEMVGHSEHVIMSDGLDVILGEDTEVEQILEISGMRFICSVLRAKAFHVLPSVKDNTWEFDLEVPGLSLSELVGIDSMTFHFGDTSFESISTFELTNPDNSGPIVSITAKRIFNNDE